VAYGHRAYCFSRKSILLTLVGFHRGEDIYMQLKTTTGYSVRVLLYLYQKRRQVIASEELARATAIPQNYLHTVISGLKGAGYVETLRGLLGGYRIVEPADEISLYDIIQVTEPEKINCCLENGHNCSNQQYGSCAVSRFYSLAQEEWDAMLKKMTLKVLAGNPDEDKLRKILKR
jgi:Rrf2 family protein